jgi:hypothetical protein
MIDDVPRPRLVKFAHFSRQLLDRLISFVAKLESMAQFFEYVRNETDGRCGPRNWYSLQLNLSGELLVLAFDCC